MIFSKCYRGDDGLEETTCLSLMAMIMLVVLTVVVVVYALYIFIGAMGIPDMAGVHITKNLMLSVKSMQGKLYTNDDKGIKNWMIYEDETNGTTVKYPNDFIVSKTSQGELEFKKDGPGMDSKNQSLLYAFVIGSSEEQENSITEEFIQKKYPNWNGVAESGFYGGKEGMRTGVFKSVSGLYKEIAYWRVGNKILYVESRYYSEKYNEYADIFNKVISEISIK
jgi:hypothetical protein